MYSRICANLATGGIRLMCTDKEGTCEAVRPEAQRQCTVRTRFLNSERVSYYFWELGLRKHLKDLTARNAYRRVPQVVGFVPVCHTQENHRVACEKIQQSYRVRCKHPWKR